MQIAINSIDFNSKKELKNFIYEKVNLLKRYCNQAISSEIFLRLEKSNSKDNKVCQIKLVIRGNDLIATARSKSFEQSTLKVVAALESQIQKLKDKRYNKEKKQIYKVDYEMSELYY